MRLEEFEYALPKELIAQFPLQKRDDARLMVVKRTTGAILHDRFASINQYLPKKSLLVLNDSKVIPARLFGKKEKTGGKVEIFLLNKLPNGDGYSFKTLIRPLRGLKVGDTVVFNGGKTTATLIDFPNRIVRFNRKDILKGLENFGHVPLPPYIKRADTPEDKEYYQTVYARRAGSVAAPTAGLHFTKELLGSLKAAGHETAAVTLHINFATFKMVEEEDIRHHKMHEEEYSLSPKIFKSVTDARAQGKRIVCVGTTSCRVLETVTQGGKLKGSTDIFIYPGFDFKLTDALITNFHLPKSSLLMLVYAFASPDLMRRAYNEAIKERYRFYSYGDAMLIL